MGTEKGTVAKIIIAVHYLADVLFKLVGTSFHTTLLMYFSN
jgi:hypothetical protein